MAEVNLHDFTMHTFQLAFLMHEVFPKCEFLFQLVIWCLEEYFDNCFQLLILNFQVGHLEEQYQEWVHQPVVSKEGPRFFENGVLEVKYILSIALYRIYNPENSVLMSGLWFSSWHARNGGQFLLSGCLSSVGAWVLLSRWAVQLQK